MEQQYTFLCRRRQGNREGVEIYLKIRAIRYFRLQRGRGAEGDRAGGIHLAIVDIMMPVMDGVTMLMKLRSKEHDFGHSCSRPSRRKWIRSWPEHGCGRLCDQSIQPLELLARVKFHLRKIFQYISGIERGRQ